MRNRLLVLVAFLVVAFFVASPASAATFADMFKTLEGSVEAAKSLLTILFPVAGFGCLGFGLFKFIQNNPQDTMFDKMIWIVVGGCLLAIVGFAAMSSESMGLSTNF